MQILFKLIHYVYTRLHCLFKRHEVGYHTLDHIGELRNVYCYTCYKERYERLR